jgi:structural maintenance of chromosome 1
MDVDEEEGDTTQRLKKVPDYGIEVDFDILSANEREVSAFDSACFYDIPLSFLTYGTTSTSVQNSPSELLGELEVSITKLNAEIERMTPNMKAMDRHVFNFLMENFWHAYRSA